MKASAVDPLGWVSRLWLESLQHLGPVALGAAAGALIAILAGVWLARRRSRRKSRRTDGYTPVFVVLLFIGLAFAFAGGLAPRWLSGDLADLADLAAIVANIGMTLAGACFSVAVLEGVIRRSERRSSVAHQIELEVQALLRSALFLFDNPREATVTSFRSEVHQFSIHHRAKYRLEPHAQDCQTLIYFYDALGRNADWTQATRKHLRDKRHVLFQALAFNEMPEDEDGQEDPQWTPPEASSLIMFNEAFDFTDAFLTDARMRDAPLVLLDEDERKAQVERTAYGDSPPGFLNENSPFPYSEAPRQEADGLAGLFDERQWSTLREDVVSYFEALEAHERLKAGMIELINRCMGVNAELLPRISQE